MITSEFLLRVFLSFIVGGLYIGMMTRLSERFGSRIGGLMIGLPSVVLVGLIFIAITQNQAALVKATTIMPATIAASSIFLMSFILLHRFGWVRAYFGALSVWFALNLPLVIFKLHNIRLSIIIAVLLFSISLTFFHRMPHRKVSEVHLTRRAFLFRIVFAGTFVAIAVLVAALLGPTWGGMFASFPAAFSATVILFVRKHGIDFTASLSRSMANANLANVVFVISLFLLVPAFGAAIGILVAYIICIVFAFLSYKYIMTYI